MGNVKFAVTKRDTGVVVNTDGINARLDLGRKLVKNIKSVMEENGIISEGSECKVGLSSILEDEDIPRTIKKRYTLTGTDGQRKLSGDVFVNLGEPHLGSCKIDKITLQVDLGESRRMKGCC